LATSDQSWNAMRASAARSGSSASTLKLTVDDPQ
jgi:hypothetical protein